MFPGDQRGVSTIIGAVLLFAILIMAMTAYQVEVVPESNRQVEYQHNLDVQEQLQSARDKIIEASAKGVIQSSSVTLGTTYKSRTFFVNPPPTTGHLETVGTANPEINITVGNATALEPETAHAWSGEQNFSTGVLKYSPNYNRYKRAPTTIYENTVVYNAFGDANLSLTDQALVQGNRINLIALNGSLNRASSETTTLNIDPASASSNTIAITGNGSGPLTITIPTYLPTNASQGTSWESLLEEQIASGQVQNLSVQDGPGEFALVTIALDANETYTLRMAKVGVGSGVTTPSANYITNVEAPPGNVEANTTHSITAEVRDRYNNPIGGFLVNATTSDGGTLASKQAQTDSDGEVTFQYTAPDTDTTDTVTLWILTNSSARQRVQFTLDVNTASSGSGDQTGPAVTSVSTNTSSVSQGNTFNLTATINDRGRGGSDIIDAEWFSNRSTPNGGLDSGYAMIATDGQFDQPREAVENLTIDTSGWTTGWHNLSVRGQDGNGTWGPLNHTVINITKSDTSPLQEVSASATSAGGSGKGTFVLKNTGNISVNITAINFTATDAPGVDRIEANNGPEIETNSTGTVNANPLHFNQQEAFDTTQVINADDTVEFNIDRFRDSGGNSVGIGGHYVNFTLSFASQPSKNFQVIFPEPGNQAPTANAGSYNDIDEGRSLTLDGTGSSDTDGSIQSYTWSINSGPGSITGGGANQTYQAPTDVSSDTSVTVELTVTDDDGATDSDTATFTVRDTGQTQAFPTGYNDGDANSANIPPSSPKGDIQNFNALTSGTDGEDASFVEEDFGNNNFPDYQHYTGLSFRNLASGSHNLTIEYQINDGDGESFELKLVDSDGDEIDTTTTYKIDSDTRTTDTIRLSTIESDYIDNNGEIFVLIEDKDRGDGNNGDSSSSTVIIDYIEITSS